MRNSIFRKIAVNSILAGRRKTTLQRNLGLFELTMMGIGVTIGSGLFVITGVAAAEHAGPGLVISFILAGIACGCAALCYAELASCIPASGGSYTFVYAGLGEIFAWFIGWCLTLEYVVGLSAIASGWSAYVSGLLPARVPQEFLSGGDINLPAMVIISMMTLLQMQGARESARLNNILVAVKLAVILIFVILAAGSIDPENYDPFLPFGWQGVFSGAAVVFFAYLGFDAVANSAEEAKNPQKNMPRALIWSLAIVTFLYIIVTLVLTGVAKYYAYDGIAAPVAFALNEAGVRWGFAMVSIGAIAGLSTGALVFIGSESRLLYSMARDGLMPELFSKLTKKGVPGRAVVCVWLFGSILAGLLPIDTIAELCNMGTLWAFSLVSITLIVMRKMYPGMRRGFRTPFVPFIPIAAVVMCIALAVQLDRVTWTVFGGWTFIGVCIYFLYGYWNSKLRTEEWKKR